MYILCLYVLRESWQTHVEPQVTQAEDGKKGSAQPRRLKGN